MARWFWLNLTYAAGGIVVVDGYVVDSAPIFKWMRGKLLAESVGYLRYKGQFIDLRELKDVKT